MADYTLELKQEPYLALPAQAAQRLISGGNGDAALLYLALLHGGGKASAQELETLLAWDAPRRMTAEQALSGMGLLGGLPQTAQEPPQRERPEYTRDDVATLLEGDDRFSSLTAEVERKLGKRLTTPDLQILIGLYDYVGLPAEVIFLLVSHCVETSEALYGCGRRPTLRQIEKIGYRWAKMGLTDLDSASNYIQKYAEEQKVLPQLMTILGLGDRRPSPSEEKYLLSWLGMGFGPEAIALAYDKTIMKCQRLRWGYLNAILTRWDKDGMHTLEQIQHGDRGPAPQGGQDSSWMKEYL